MLKTHTQIAIGVSMVTAQGFGFVLVSGIVSRLAFGKEGMLVHL